MNIKIAAAGRLGKGYIREGVDDYRKRISKYVPIEIIEINDEKVGESASEKELLIVKQREAARLLSHIKESSFVCALDINGKQPSTEEFADFINKKMMDRTKELIFVIGGSVGLCDGVLKRADLVLSFSKMTFPHKLMRLILLEQLYRAEKIIRGEPYHK